MKKINPLKNTRTTLITYTILFCILMAGIFAVFIYEGKSFVDIYDAYDQGYFWTVEMNHNLRSFFSGEGYPLWSWDRGTGLDTKLPIDPFLVLASLFPPGKIELGYSIAIILRAYFAGIAFILFCREVELSNFQALLGSICYIGSTWSVNLMLMQGQFVDLMILFPLLAMSVDRIYKRKSPAMFMLIVGLTVGVNYYLAYMASIVIIIYLLLRYFRYNEFSAGRYFGYMGRFILYGVTGIMIGAVFVLVTIRTLSGASTGSSHSFSWLYGLKYYIEIGQRLLSRGFSLSYNYIGLPVFALLVLITVKGRPTVKATHVLMAAILFCMTLSPFFPVLFNGFGYGTNRWYFLLIFFLTWCAAEHMDLDELSKTHNLILMLVSWLVISVTTAGFAYLNITGNMRIGTAMFVAGNLAAGLVMIVIVAMGRGIIKSLRVRQSLIILSVVGTLMVVWTCSCYNHLGVYFDLGEVNDQLEASTQRAGSRIEDDGFYRIDQADWINTHLKADQPANENLQWQNNTIYLYDSKIPSRLLEFNRLLGNNMGYSKRVYVQSNGNRMGLDFLYGIKYFLGDDTKNERTGADAHAGYAFDYYDNIDGVNVFRSRYDSSIGFVYDKYIRESEFLKLSRLEREQALLQAVVMPDGTEEGLDETREVKAEDIETDITDVPYEIVDYDGVKQKDDNLFVVKRKNGAVVIKVDDIRSSQLVVSFDNLRRVTKSGKNRGNFILSCTDGRITSEANNRQNNQTIPGIVDYDLNMGYCDDYSGYLMIKFSQKGRYEFDRLYVSAMSTDNFDKYAAERCKSVFNVSEQKSTRVSGTLDADDDGYLFLSMPVSDNWNVFIDDMQAAEFHNANIAFFATPVTKGEHKVELRYDMTSRYIALAITLTGLALMVVLSVIDRKRRGKSSETYASKH